jgi:hypothetical protein
VERQLEEHIGGKPKLRAIVAYPPLCSSHGCLELLDDKMSKGNWTETDARTFGALSNIARLTPRELSVTEAPEKLISLVARPPDEPAASKRPTIPHCIHA